MYIFLDFETRSELDVTEVGAHCYAMHHSTRPLILCFAVDAGVVYTITDFTADPFVGFEHYTFVAHNAAFERAIIEHCTDWAIPENWLDTAAMARRAGLPGGLDNCAAALDLEHLKDPRGKSLIRLFSQLQKATKKSKRAEPYFVEPHERSGEFADFCAYCAQDVRTERDIFYAIGPDIMTPLECAAYERNYQANRHGIRIDLDLLRGARAIVDSETARAGDALAAITDGQITAPTQAARIAAFCGLEAVTANDVFEALKNPELDADAVAVLRIRRDTGKSSTSKLEALEARLCADGRVRDLTLYHGAHTGRETGAGPQPLNMPRGTVKLDSAAFEAISAGDATALRARYGSPMAAVSSALRGLFVPTEPGDSWQCVDMAQIEARLVFWFAREWAPLQVFREGGDLYRQLAGTIYYCNPVDVTKEQREIGKRGILGLGYGMGAPKFRQTVYDNARLTIDLQLAETAKTAYRTKYRRIPALWRALERGAKNAIQTGEPQTVFDRATYWIKDRWLICTLPSGRDLYYFDPIVTEDGLTHMAMVAGNGKRIWKREKTYGGKLTENIVQATARDLLQYFMSQIRGRIALTVYDEILCEGADMAHVLQIMKTPPEWCADLPLGADGWEGERYRK